MEKVYEELDEAKSEIDKLKAELRAKSDSLENLKRSLNAQVNQTQEAKSKSEKLDQELLQKADEIAEAKSLYESLKGNLKEQESIIKHLKAANDKLRVDFDEKIKMWENEKRGLVLALEEANDKAENQDQQVCRYRKEIESLKSCLSVSKQKCSESQKKLKSSKELSERDGMFQKLEEEKVKLEDQLKWKKEQFKHLEEAYEKLKGQFKSSKKEWEMEKSTLLDEISSLETKLESQIRISEDLQHQLQTCHQALAHVESQKKRLEVEVSDFRLQLDNAGSEYHDARLQLDCLNSDRDKDIVDLRYSLKTKEAHIKEAKYQMEKLEQENQELRMSLRELQESQIQAGAYYSQSKLRTKLKNLEQTHKECALTLKAREAEWDSRIEQLTGQLNTCQSELEAKIAAVEELQMELESSHLIVVETRLLNEEMSVMLLVLKQGISEAQLRLANYKDEMDLLNKEKEREIFQLMKQLEMKDDSLISAQKGLNEEREKAECLMRKIESFGSSKELQRSLQNEPESYGCNKELQNELDRYKEMLEESTRCQRILEEKVLQIECESKEQLRETHEALDIAINELDERICERSEMEFELQIWKSILDRLKNDLEESHLMRKELEASLIAQVDVGESIKQEKDKAVEELQKEVFMLEQESFRREFESVVIAKSTMERACELTGNATELSLERENLLAFVQGLYDRIYELSNADTQLKDMLRSMEESFEIDGAGVNLKKDDNFFHVKENMSVQVSPASRIKKVEAISDARSPFKELNSSW
ncbi:hypothetical protein MtrunA17_Chr8g0367551 [Medicago truncatula]|uniref:Basic helix loop helix protein, putative n=1 Tax=Medicago truncatula TaxID=3880 RepID=A0A072TTF3_MEDTR|nr:uncharacterized protein At4g38062 [Medicago truncatula]XP_024627645.1 uncharacterized protein At4g38062 [Medicago truncatula]KEH20138.1 basic helix loop helix protein, putative [Medicago truncatula]RHN41580.1 hypothetical protein MtrunA17_Chr8g0367551 [Medicago truncatula]